MTHVLLLLLQSQLISHEWEKEMIRTNRAHPSFVHVVIQLHLRDEVFYQLVISVFSYWNKCAWGQVWTQKCAVQKESGGYESCICFRNKVLWWKFEIKTQDRTLSKNKVDNMKYWHQHFPFGQHISVFKLALRQHLFQLKNPDITKW
jgi:hypothetical protein